MPDRKTALPLDGVVLWRDGAQAVVSIKVNGEWHRLLATECDGMFHAAISGAEMRALPAFRYWQARSAAQKRRRAKELAG